MAGLGKRDNKGERPYLIAYVRSNGRRLSDSARSLEDAHARIAARLSKPQNRREHAEIWLLRAGPAEMIYSSKVRLGVCAQGPDQWAVIDLSAPCSCVGKCEGNCQVGKLHPTKAHAERAALATA